MNFTEVPLQIGKGFAKDLTRCQPRVGLAELIWNSVDADATKVTVGLHGGEMGGLRLVEVADNGTGMLPDLIQKSFDRLGDSWKAERKTTDKGRILHGHKGHGRFKSLGIGHSVTWTTDFREPTGEMRRVVIRLNSDDPKRCFVSDPESSGSLETGTTVAIENISCKADSLSGDKAIAALTEEFAHYLLRNVDVRITVDGRTLDAEDLIDHSESRTLSVKVNDRDIPVTIRFVEWKTPEEHRRIILCRPNGVAIGDLPMRSHLLDGKVTAYVECAVFERAGVGDLPAGLVEGHGEMAPVIELVRSEAKAFENRRLEHRSMERVKEWKEQDVYPYDSEPSSSVDVIERRVFNLVAYEIENRLNKFRQLERRTKQMHFTLLKLVVETQPEHLVRALVSTGRIPQAALREVEGLLNRHGLVNVLKLAKAVDDRLSTLDAIDVLLHDRDWSKNFLERQHLHKLVAGNTWIFGEQFNLMANEEGLTTLVRREIERRQLPIVLDGEVRVDNRRGRVDLMLTASAGSPALNLVVELKRPGTVGQKEMNQVKQYALALARTGITNSAQWHFWLIGTDVHEDVKAEANQENRPSGLIVDAPSYKVWAKSWHELLVEARQRHRHLREALNYSSSKEADIEMLRKENPGMVPRRARVAPNRPKKTKVRRETGPNLY